MPQYAESVNELSKQVWTEREHKHQQEQKNCLSPTKQIKTVHGSGLCTLSTRSLEVTSSDRSAAEMRTCQTCSGPAACSSLLLAGDSLRTCFAAWFAALIAPGLAFLELFSLAVFANLDLSLSALCAFWCSSTSQLPCKVLNQDQNCQLLCLPCFLQPCIKQTQPA